MNKKIKIASKLRSSGLRPTKQRIQIAEFLFEREKTFHFSVEDLDHLINKSSKKKISLATFYNTFQSFKKSVHLKEILTNNNKSYFDTHTGSHHHFFDKKNNELIDIDSNLVELKVIPKAPKGKCIKDIDVVINIDNDSH